MAKALLPTPRRCTHGNATLFYKETQDMCCRGGKVTLTQVPVPEELLQLFSDNSAEGRHFRQHIRSYIHVLSFTSLGVHIDENLIATGRGIYTFRAQGAQLALQPNVQQCRFIIKERPINEPQYNLPSASQVSAIVVGCDEDTIERGRDINVVAYDGSLTNVQETKGFYDPLQYPILYPFGTYGWDLNTKNNIGGSLTCRAYYSYMLQIRHNDRFVFLKSGRLLQQYVVDNYVKIEMGILRWVRQHQANIRSEVYQGLQDALHDGENNGDNVGQRTILPSSFIGSKRDMAQRYQDGMAIVLKDGKPDIFLTMTCNPWSEITSELGPHQTPQDRPDLLTRIFRSKFEQLKEDVIKKGVLGKVKSYMYVTEFQKRGLPHVHMLLILDNDDKLREPEDYDRVYYNHQRIVDVLNDNRNSITMLTEFFALNQVDPHARNFLYREIPEHYCWLKGVKKWRRRQNPRKAIGRIYTVSPSEGEKFYLCVLLSHLRGPTSWECLLTYNGTTIHTFKQAAERRGYLECDNSIRDCLVTASNIQLPYALRRLFVTVLIFCEPTDVRGLFNEFYPHMVEDYQTRTILVGDNLTNILLRELKEQLLLHGKFIENYDLPAVTFGTTKNDGLPTTILEELLVQIPNEDIQSVEKLNNDQMIAFNTIMNVINQKQTQIFFIDGPGGTGKTFLYRAIMAVLRSRGEIVLAAASSGIAATLLPGARTAHSRFGIPFDIEPRSFCKIGKNSNLAKLIRRATAIIWDEAPMINRYCLEALDRSLQDVMSCNAPFGGKKSPFSDKSG
ncbi:unnamed protein product [Trifolium pratense]|uniref:Uncharacterized protein n=1 Tax=Trifolium pratense TaxID=57577 RepID=A0ACB0JMU2_TRIPR|nr:unnamed protein product [Trifolium pratense]